MEHEQQVFSEESLCSLSVKNYKCYLFGWSFILHTFQFYAYP
jgi:hypothetical protein